jgi:hypothetical protein
MYMKTKRKYFKPEIELIRLDSEISLQLESDVNPDGEPTGPGWSASNQQDYFSNNPLQDIRA